MQAREIGYEQIRLDTVEPVMKDALALVAPWDFEKSRPTAPTGSLALSTWNCICRAGLPAQLQETK